MVWFEDHGQMVEENTKHQTVSSSLQQSCIDLLFAKEPLKVNVHLSLGSDHCVLDLEISKVSGHL